MQEGCKYKHEFPDDDETRASIGLRKFPTWMRDDPAVPIKPLAALPLHATAPAYQSPSWRSRSGSQPPQAELAGGIKPLNQSPFSPVANTGSCSTQPQNTVRAQSPAPSMQPQNSKYNNQAQQVPFFAPPQPYFPNHASHNPQQQSRPFSGAFGKGNGHGHNSQIPVDSFNRRMPTHTANGSYNPPVGSVIHPRRASPPTQAPIGRPVANVQSFAPDTRVNGQQQTSGNAYNHAAPDARARNAPVYTPTHTSSSQDLQNGATTPVANVDGIASGNNNHNTQAHHFGNTNSNGNGSAPANFDFRAPTPATSSINGNAPTEFNGGQPLMSNDIHQLNINTQPLTPTTLNNNAPGNFDGNVDVDAIGSGVHAKQSDVSQATPNSPAYLHRRMFIPEGEPRYVANPVKEVHQKGRGFKKHGSSSGKHAHKGGRATLSETLI